MADQATLDKALAITDAPDYKPADSTGYTVDVNNLDEALDTTEGSPTVQVSYVVVRDEGNLGVGAYPTRQVADGVISRDRDAVAKAKAADQALASQQSDTGVTSTQPSPASGSASATPTASGTATPAASSGATAPKG